MFSQTENRLLDYVEFSFNRPIAEFYAEFLETHPEITSLNLFEHTTRDDGTYPLRSYASHINSNNLALTYLHNQKKEYRGPGFTDSIGFTFGVGTKIPEKWEISAFTEEWDQVQGHIPEYYVALPVLDFDSPPTEQLLGAIETTCEAMGTSAMIGHSGRSFHLILAKPCYSDLEIWQTWASTARNIMETMNEMPHWFSVITDAINAAQGRDDLMQIAKYIHYNRKFTTDPEFKGPDVRHLKNSLLFNGLQRSDLREEEVLNLWTQQFLRIGAKDGKNIPRAIKEVQVPGTPWFDELEL